MIYDLYLYSVAYTGHFYRGVCIVFSICASQLVYHWLLLNVITITIQVYTFLLVEQILCMAALSYKYLIFMWKIKFWDEL